MATRVVQHFAGIDAQRAGSQQYYLYRVLRQLDLSNLLQRLIHEAGESGGDTTRLDDRLVGDEQRHRIEAFRRGPLDVEKARADLVGEPSAERFDPVALLVPNQTVIEARRVTTGFARLMDEPLQEIGQVELAEDAVEVVLLGAGALRVDAGEVLDDARRHRPQGALVVSSQGVVKGLQEVVGGGGIGDVRRSASRSGRVGPARGEVDVE